MEEKDGGWLLDKAVQLKFLSGEPVVRTVNGKQELLVPLMFDGTGKSSVVYEIIW
jgi:hypothetical protein